MNRHTLRRAVLSVLAIMLVSTGCGTPVDIRGALGATTAPDKPLSADDLAGLGDDVVLQVVETGPPRPDAPENPVLEVRANGNVTAWDAAAGQVTGVVRAEEVVALLDDVHSLANPLEGEHIGDEELHCFGFSIEWLSPNGAPQRAHWECGDFSEFDGLEEWVDATRAAVAQRFETRVVVEHNRGALGHAGPSVTPEDLRALGDEVVLSVTVGTWAPSDAERNPLMELRSSGDVTLWDDQARAHVTGKVDLELIALAVAGAHELGNGHQGIYDDPEELHCGATNYEWLQPDLQMGRITVACATFEGREALDQLLGRVQESMLGQLGDAHLTEPVEPGPATPDPDGLAAYVEHADEVYLRGADIDERIAQLEANCVSLDRLSLIASNVSSRPAAVPDFLVQHLFVCLDLVTRLELDFDRAFEEDLAGLRSLAASTNPRVLEDEALFSRFAGRLREDCSKPQQLARMLDTNPEPDAWLLGWHAFICPRVVSGLGA